ncbi:hypothetical protein PR202_gb25941 [Eleusine coracana subsp. coracana]|uniref:Uncharacterized protein n=1 Tax=Eleusine coracana subsp. coracana TaxID=191504 RepID=A0AAV5FQA3_ELECO|nr:hypothetical protein PR202_gb25941 [Eleusine coracana subsp. coracana]
MKLLPPQLTMSSVAPHGRLAKTGSFVHLRGCLRGRDNDGWHRSDPEQHQRAVPARKAVQRSVWGRADEVVEAADDGEVPWAWRKLGAGFFVAQSTAVAARHRPSDAAEDPKAREFEGPVRWRAPGGPAEAAARGGNAGCRQTDPPCEERRRATGTENVVHMLRSAAGPAEALELFTEAARQPRLVHTTESCNYMLELMRAP